MDKIENIPVHFSLEGWFHYLLEKEDVTLDSLDHCIFLPISNFSRNYSAEVWSIPDFAKEYANREVLSSSNTRSYEQLFEDKKNATYQSLLKSFVLKAEEAFNDSTTLNLIPINRDGFYHKLPYFLFHKFNTNENEKQTVNGIEDERHELINAMKHLLPLDNEFILQRILLFHKLNSITNLYTQEYFNEIFGWKLKEIEDNYQIEIKEIPELFLRMIPLKNMIAQNFEWFQLGFELFMIDFLRILARKELNEYGCYKNTQEMSITTSLNFIEPKDYSEHFAAHDEYVRSRRSLDENKKPHFFAPAPRLRGLPLGKCKLGVNAICGTPIPDEQYIEATFTIGKRKHIGLFIEYENKRNKLNIMAEMFFDFFAPLNRRLLFPFNIDVTEKVLASLIEAKPEVYSNVLGYGSIIKD